jgi:hypothetical protein
MSNRCAIEHAIVPVAGRPARAAGAPLFTTWHALRRHIDLCRTSTAMCRATH